MNMALNQIPPLQSVNHEVFRPFFKCQKTIGETTQHCSALRLGPLEPWISTVFFELSQLVVEPCIPRTECGTHVKPPFRQLVKKSGR